MLKISKPSKLTCKILFVKKGFSLVELLIGVSISAVISIGVGSIFLSVLNTQNVQKSVGEMRDTSFIAFDIIDYALKNSGFINYGKTIDIAPSAFSSPFVTTGSVYTKDATSVNTSDTLVIQTNVPDSSKEMVACTGESFPTNTDTVKYSIEQEFSVSNDILRCRVKDNQTNVYGNYSNVATGVKNMQLYYAVDIGNGCGITAIGSTMSWKTQTNMTSDDWTKVCAINIFLLTISQSKQLSKTEDTTANKVFDLRPNTNVVDTYANNISVNSSNNLATNARVINKVIRLRN